MMTNLISLLHTTAAYQTAVLQLLVGQANNVAKQLDLKEPLPIMIPAAITTNGNEIFSPVTGVGGSILTSNYVYSFRKGQVEWIQKIGWANKINPPLTNTTAWTYQISLIDTNGAYTLATQWLSALSIDVRKLEGQYPAHVFQSTVPGINGDQSNLEEKERIPIPLFEISWSQQSPPYNPTAPVRVKILGTTKELLQLSIRDVAFFTQAPLCVTNATELLGPLPPPRHFVEELVGGKDAYETVVSPDRVEAWLLNGEGRGERPQKAIRTGLLELKPKIAKAFSAALLDFDSYWWTAQKLCSPDYGLRLRFIRGSDKVEFILCYDCDILQVTHNGKTKEENFDFAHNKLVKALQGAFPKDEVVKKLKLDDEAETRQEFEGMLKSL